MFSASVGTFFFFNIRINFKNRVTNNRILLFSPQYGVYYTLNDNRKPVSKNIENQRLTDTTQLQLNDFLYDKGINIFFEGVNYKGEYFYIRKQLTFFNWQGFLFRFFSKDHFK
ncbi:hypothetical protein PSM36_2495 [Proteiniphilum saccharofermentans]|uniref:Uncharacterized protein n=1 Tax=Proteiniphilum saccharofermentans TaxID=1642647 RepID=A0A1R3SYM2_9BACT|nr:hypothetical protein PSM36_2495 [Proteiniphilum saccharofermentans]